MAGKEKFKTTIGGQALIEGILMRGPKKTEIVVRKTDGSLVYEERETSKKAEIWFFKLPIVRGVYRFAESMRDGMSALTFSAQFFEEDEKTEPQGLEKFLVEKFGSEKVEKTMMTIATAIGVIIPIALFILLPTLLAGVFDEAIGTGVVRNLVEGAIRISLFLLFLLSVSRIKDIKRTFAYHGAEHKSISCYESGEELTVENVRKHTRLHPRCGTSFLFVVIIISILIFSMFTWSNPFLRVALRLALLPVIVGISYEINRFAGRYDNVLTKVIRAPGMWLQKLTTNEPDDSMIEVAIEALKCVIPENEDEARW